MHSHDALHNNPPPSITINNILKFQADDEKVARNRQKQEDAIRSLKEETDALMDSLRANNAQRQRLMTERCSWLRNLVLPYARNDSLFREHVTSHCEALRFAPHEVRLRLDPQGGKLKLQQVSSC